MKIFPGSVCRRRALSSSAGKSHDDRMAKVSLPTYGQGGNRTKPGLVFARGQGIKLWDTQGKEYYDFSAGIAVNVLGHCPPLITNALIKQANKLGHVSNLYHTEENLRLNEKLIELSPGFAKVFLCNSGTEANEAALKFAALRAFAKGDKRNRILSFKNSFHGRTLGSLSVTYKPAIRAPFASLLHDNVDFLDFNNLDQVKDYMDHDVLAVIVEPVQGEGGVNPASPHFLKGLRDLCNQYESTLIFDEVQIGLGRGGKLWGHQSYPGVIPDVMTCAKPLAGGLPIGAALVSEQFWNQVPAEKWLGAHGTTFGGNPLIAQVAYEVLCKVSDPLFLQAANQSGARLVQGLDAIQKRNSTRVLAVKRPLGDEALYAGVKLTSAQAGKVVLAALERGVVFITAGDYGDTIRICPPLIATPQDVDVALRVLEEAIQSVSDWPVVAQPPVVAPTTTAVGVMRNQTFTSLQAHRDFVNHPLPIGFQVGADKLTFVPKELPTTGAKSFPMRMSLIALESGEATDQYAMVLTKNAFPGAPIRVAREISNSMAKIGGVLINNKVSNVHPRGGGVQDAITLTDACAKQLGLPLGARVLGASTGVIGWSLPVPEMLDCLPRVVNNLASNVGALVAAEAIMTTDKYPKARSEIVQLENGKVGRITGIAKGAGMIEPNMATMLVYIMTDIALSKPQLQQSLNLAVNRPGSFNRITVDSDQSTSDMVVLLSSGKIEATQQDLNAFNLALNKVCAELAEDIVRNGEGTKHVIRIAVKNAPTVELAHGVGKAVANSPLVKTAIYGNDPNVGRIIAAFGSYLGKQPSMFESRSLAKHATVKVGGVIVFEKSEFCLDATKEQQLSRILREAQLDYTQGDFPAHDRVVDVEIDLNLGAASTVVIGSDLSHEYVEVNADYRS
ncbi:glutamate N-acetyltransferase/amino-acid acetyltransferase [Batrachochytrium salamandrivorans]|nr:glutamate N-acetyltransferase/amino-acid acetyltransferase [Batrachochytrium salamandrivorans]